MRKQIIVFGIILILILSGLFLYPQTLNVDALSSWKITSDTDFINGTSQNLSINDSGTNANLILKKHLWINKTSLNKPSARTKYGFASIWNTDKILLFGGTDDNGQKKSDTWIYDLSDNSWTFRNLAISPSPRAQLGMTSVDGDDKVVLFGGRDYKYNNDTWIYDLSENKWINRTQPSEIRPSARINSGMTYIKGDDKVLLFGGYDKRFDNETWIYDVSDNEWTQRIPDQSPSVRTTRISIIDGTDQILLFGGNEGNIKLKLEDTWIYDYGDNTWTKMDPIGNPPGRAIHGLTSIPGTDQVLLHSGWNTTSTSDPPLDDTWIYDKSEDIWEELNLTIRPKPTIRILISFVFGTDKIVLFGGENKGEKFNETWVFDLVFPSGTFDSQPYSTGRNSTYKTISWNADTPIGTSIHFQLRTANNESDLATKSFIGPDGSTGSFYTTKTGENIWSGHSGYRWIQYRVYFNSDTANMPSLQDVTLSYNLWPNTNLISPVNNSYVSNNKPTFTWNMNDLDSDQQSAYQVIIDDDNEFRSINYDSGLIDSQITSYTPVTEIMDGTWYWKVRVKDNDGDWGEFSDEFVLNIDTQSPSSAPITPINNGFYNDLNLISGIAFDPKPSSGLNKIEIAIKRNDDNKYWDGSSWIDLPSWLQTTLNLNWTYDSSAVTWISGKQYTIQSRAIDNASNQQIPGSGNIFTIDKQSPTSIIDKPDNNTFTNNLININGTCVDFGPAGIKQVELTIKDTYNNFCWNGTSWNSNESWLPAIRHDSENWYYKTITVDWRTDRNYIFQSRAIDKADNIEKQNIWTKFMFDNKPPEISIIINDNEKYTNNKTVDLKLYSFDSGSGNSKMAFSIDNLTWSTWEDYSQTKQFNLSSGDGEKKVYFKVQDKAGNVKKSYDEIILDTIPPTSSKILINDGADETNSTQVSLIISGKDDLSGIHQMSFSIDGINWNAWEDYETQKDFQLSSGEGIKTIYLKLKDTAGNIAEPVSDSITLKTKSNIEDDTDGDDIPDSVDDDDDGDGYTDKEELDAGTDPLNKNDHPTVPPRDTDNDNLPDIEDTDDDNDKFPDTWETLLGTDPLLTSSKPLDTDNDGKPDGDKDNTETWMDTDDDGDGHSDAKEIKEGTDPLDSEDYPSEKKGDGFNMMIILIIVIIIIVILLVIFALLRRKKPKEEIEEYEEKFAEEPLEEEESEEEYEEELEEEELEEFEDREFEEEPEMETEIMVEPGKMPKEGEEIGEYEFAKGKLPEKGTLDEGGFGEELFDDTEVGKGKGAIKPGKGEAPIKPKKGKLVTMEDEIIIPEFIDTSEPIEPELIKLDKSVPCGVCLGSIKTGLLAIKCHCGKYYHESCGIRVAECPKCERKFKLEKLAKVDEDLEDIEELEESELPPEEFEQKKEAEQKTEREKMAKIISGLEERLAAGEISEETYLMLRKKYESNE